MSVGVPRQCSHVLRLVAVSAGTAQNLDPRDHQATQLGGVGPNFGCWRWLLTADGLRSMLKLRFDLIR